MYRTTHSPAHHALLPTAAVAAALLAHSVCAQNADSAAAASGARRDTASGEAPRGAGVLEEVVVTATRQTSTVNEVPLSITAATQDTLDQQGIDGVADLQTTVPGVFLNQSLGPGIANIAIRGIAQGSQGAATTGFYLDDTPIQKRNVGGGVATANGTPLPPIFDLERVEVLRGPQGTLYGGSSEGGTVRFITPTPDLEDYAVYGKASIATIEDGSTGHEAGLAVSAPLVKERLGARVSYDDVRRAGWIDIVDPFTGQVTHQDANANEVRQFRGTVLWQATDRLRATVSYFGSSDSTSYASSAFNLPTKEPIVIPTACYDTSGITPERHVTNPQPVAVGDAACAAAAAAGTVTYTRPSQTFGPYALEGHQVLAKDLSPASTKLSIPALTLEYDRPAYSVKLVASAVRDESLTTTEENSQITNVLQNATEGSILSPHGWPYLADHKVAGSYRNQAGHFTARNRRRGTSEELRFTSADGDSAKLTWVAGLYYADSRTEHQYREIQGDMEGLAQALYGMTELQRYGVAPDPTGYNAFFGEDLTYLGADIFDHKNQKLHDRSIAIYGEANYSFTDKLQGTLGIRQSQETFDYWQQFYGPVDSAAVATPENGLESTGHVKEQPFTPKIGVTYRFADARMLYFTASKGFRPGGVNGKTSENICGPALAQYGLTVDDVPVEYKSDTVWSYEAGAKARLFGGNVQINGDVYRIDWTDVQATQSPGFGCGIVFTTNAGRATSQGIDIEAQARFFEHLTADVAFGYDNAEYTEDSVAIHGPVRDLIVALEGQEFALPPWTLHVGLRYDFAFGDRRPYVRADWLRAAGYDQSRFPLGGYNPGTNHVPESSLVNLRAGVALGNYDLNLFVQNALDTDKGRLTGGYSGCSNAACSAYYSGPLIGGVVGPQPRTVGLEILFRQ
ncbi:MAG TPA: TonB-dependent receptor [Gammaproteobacteria bacterium]|nr:TonB-dependent receptor [Gammaproteobacteria bacterium]